MEEYGLLGRESASSSDNRSDESDTQEEELERGLPGYRRGYELAAVCSCCIVGSERLQRGTKAQDIRSHKVFLLLVLLTLKIYEFDT